MVLVRIEPRIGEMMGSTRRSVKATRALRPKMQKPGPNHRPGLEALALFLVERRLAS
jgi:hypothetical protein